VTAFPVSPPPDFIAEDAAHPVAVDPEEQLATRAAWLYFMAGLTQDQIGKRLGVNRVRVNRLIADAREQGLVQITVTGRLADCVALEEQLKRAFDLKDVVVVPTPPDPGQLRLVIGLAAGQYLGSCLKDGMSVGVGWGRTLRLSLRAVRRRDYNRISVVSLIGGLTQSSAVNPHETASHLADVIGAQCYYFAAPAFTDTAATKAVLMNQPMLREVYERGRRADLAFLSVGEIGPANTMAQLGLISPAEVASLKAAGAVGDICSHWIDSRGRMVDHPLNDRAIGLSPANLQEVPRVILVSGGPNKTDVIAGALRAGYANILVTDEVTAEALLASRTRDQ
jgi:DNA-binding transcriptional regulator LsrR (DeoR family)